MMKIPFYIISLLLFLHHFTMAQPDSIPLHKNLIYLEAGGQGGFGSINYERSFPLKPRLKLAARIGISSYKLKDFTTRFNPDIIIPVAVNICYGFSPALKHHAELGLGQTLTSIRQVDPANFQPQRKNSLHACLAIGYRYQKKDGRFMLRCSYTPLLEFYKNFIHWAGLSLGFAF